MFRQLLILGAAASLMAITAPPASAQYRGGPIYGGAVLWRRSLALHRGLRAAVLLVLRWRAPASVRRILERFLMAAGAASSWRRRPTG